MSAVKIRIHAPFYSAGIPGWAETALRTAGLMVDELTAAEWLRGLPPQKWPDALVLFDSRRPDSRETGREMQRHGLTTVDVAPATSAAVSGPSPGPFLPGRDERDGLLRPAGSHPPFLQEFKDCVEERHFLWARVADCPYPFQELSYPTGENTGCQPAVFGLSGNPGQNRPLADALLWEPAEEKLAAWLRFRRRIGFRLFSEAGLLQLESRIPGTEFRPAVEIWQGRHFASVPLKAGALRLEKQSLVFQVSGDRNPAGRFVESSSVKNSPHILQPVRTGT